MARDPRKNSAFDSGMRGREKPKIQGAHGGTFGQQSAGTVAGGESKQGASTTVGDPDGVGLNDSAYSSGMRGMEKAKQKPAAAGRSQAGDATFGQTRGSSEAPGNKQGANTTIGNPDGDDTAGTGARKGVKDAHLQSAASASKKLGIPGNNTEAATSAVAPTGAEGILGEEDDTHINIRIPKASLKRKNSGLQGN